MKINEVEAQVGITKKNIRFYEEQGLLSPRRNSENGYRDYGEAEVAVLRQIKLMRKLGVPLEEIRRMQAGGTVADGMRRHLVTLERERKSLEQSIQLCGSLKDREERLDALDAAALLEEMERLEQTGTTFQDKQKQDAKPVRYAGAVVMALLTTALMAALIVLMVWAFTVDPADAPPLALLLVLVAIPGVIILGVLLALVQRIREIHAHGKFRKEKKTMRKTTDQKGHGLVGGVIVTVLVVGLVLLVLATLFQTFGPVIPFLTELGAAFGVMLFYAGAILAVGIGVVIALIQRWKEIKGGEEDEAKKY